MFRKKAQITMVALLILCVFMILFFLVLNIGSKVGLLSINRDVTVYVKTYTASTRLYSILNAGTDVKNMELFGWLYSNYRNQKLWDSVKSSLDSIFTDSYGFSIVGTSFSIGDWKITNYAADIPIPGAGGSGKIKGKVNLGT